MRLSWHRDGAEVWWVCRWVVVSDGEGDDELFAAVSAAAARRKASANVFHERALVHPLGGPERISVSSRTASKSRREWASERSNWRHHC